MNDKNQFDNASIHVDPPMKIDKQPSYSLSQQTQTGEKEIKDEIRSLIRAKEFIDSISANSRTLINDSDAIPVIQSRLRPLISGIESNYPKLIAACTQFFTYVTAKRKKGSRIAFSTGPVLPTMKDFSSFWDPFVAAIHEFSQRKQLPHTTEISVRFQGIILSLDTIQKYNSERKHPNAGITACIQSMKALCSRLSKSCLELYQNPAFPNFKGSVMELYIKDVDSLQQVLMDAFRNELVQCGLTANDYQRVKMTIVGNIGLINSALKASFKFSHDVNHIWDEILSFQNEVQWVIDEIYSKFCVFRQEGYEDIPEEVPEQKNKKEKDIPKVKSLSKIVEFVGGEISSQLAAVDYEPRLRMFLREILPCLDLEYDSEGDVLEQLLLVEKNIRSLSDKINEQAAYIKENDKLLEELNNEIYENQLEFDKKNTSAKQVNATNIKSIEDLKNELAKVKKENEEISAQLREKDEEIEKLKQKEEHAQQYKTFLTDMNMKLTTFLGQNENSEFDFAKFSENIDNVINMAQKPIKEEPLPPPIEIIESEQENEKEIHEEDKKEQIIDQEVKKEEDPPKPSRKRASILEYGAPNSLKTNDENKKSRAARKMTLQPTRAASTVIDMNRREEFNYERLRPTLELLDILSGLNSSQKKIQSLEDYKDLVDERCNKIQDVYNIHYDKMSEMEDEIAHCQELLLPLGIKHKELHDSINVLIEKYKNQVDPLNKEIQNLNDQCSQKDTDYRTIIARIKALAKASNLDFDPKSDVLEIMEKIQENNFKHTKSYIDLEEMIKKFRKALQDIETRLYSISSEEIDQDADDDQIIKSINLRLDVLLESSYSQDFIRVSQINDIFKNVMDVRNRLPLDYLKSFVIDYEKYRKSINSVQKFRHFIEKLDKNQPLTNDIVVQMNDIIAEISSETEIKDIIITINDLFLLFCKKL